MSYVIDVNTENYDDPCSLRNFTLIFIQVGTLEMINLSYLYEILFENNFFL